MAKLKTDYRILFYAVIGAAGLWSLGLMLITNGMAIGPFYFSADEYFMDFFNHVAYVNDRAHVYQADFNATFPPLAYVLYYFIRRIIPIYGTPSAYTLRDNLYGLMTYFTYTAALVIVFVCLASVYLKNKKTFERTVLCLLILMSSTFITLYERGNSAFIVLLLLMGFYLLKEHESPAMRELSLFLLAAAAALKLYPAVFGLLYLKKGRLGEAARLTAYGLLLFFLPFAFFGGFGQIPVLFSNLKLVTELTNWGELRSVSCITVLIGQKLGLELEGLLRAGSVFSLIFFLFSCAGVIAQKSEWKRALLLVGIMLYFPRWSGSYTQVYLALPFLLFFGKEQGNTPLNLLYSLEFALVFSSVLWEPSWSFHMFGSNFNYAVRCFGVIFLILTVLLDTWREKGIKRRL